MSNEDRELLDDQEDDAPFVKRLKASLREARKTADERGVKLRSQAFEMAGIDSSSGFGALLFEKYEGSDYTVDEVREFASGLNVEIDSLSSFTGAKGDDETMRPKDVADRSESQQALIGGQNTADKALKFSQPKAPTTDEDEALAKAKAEGDHRTAIAIKDLKIARLME